MITKQIRTGLLTALLGLAAMDAAATNVTVDQGQTLFGSEIQTITINPATGDISIKTKAGNWGLSQSGGTNPDPDPNGKAPTVDLKVDNQDSVTVTEGTSVRLSWSINDADSCQTTNNGVPAWTNQTINLFAGNANGQADITVDFTSTKSFRLSCSNPDGTTIDTVSVTGQAKTGGNPDTPTPDSCPNVGQVDIVNWTSVSGGVDFPSFYGTRTVTMEGSTPMAIRFNTLTSGSKTYGGFAVVPSTDTYAPREIAVSTCPGVFDVPKRCAKYNIGTLHWELDLDKGYFHTCKLDQGTSGQTYYLNVRFPDGCEDRFCSAKIGTE